MTDRTENRSSSQQLRNVVNHAEVFCIHDIRSLVVLFHWKILSRTSFLHQTIFPAAWLGTSPLIRIPSCQIGGQQATP